MSLEPFSIFHHNVLIYLLTVCVLWLFLTVSWVGRQCMILVFHEHTRFLVNDYYNCTDDCYI